MPVVILGLTGAVDLGMWTVTNSLYFEPISDHSVTLDSI